MGPQLKSMLAGTPVIIPVVSRVSVVHVDEMTGRVPLGVAGNVCWNSVTPDTPVTAAIVRIIAIAYRLRSWNEKLGLGSSSRQAADD
jgi:hypothetical protein